jgi:hypothetical protein
MRLYVIDSDNEIFRTIDNVISREGQQITFQSGRGRQTIHVDSDMIIVDADQYDLENTIIDTIFYD